VFFGAIENFKRRLLEARPYPKTLIIRLERVPFGDITARAQLLYSVKYGRGTAQ
jgi:hypothetical protein